MGDKEEKTLTRLELADYLKNLSEQLRQGRHRGARPPVDRAG